MEVVLPGSQYGDVTLPVYYHRHLALISLKLFNNIYNLILTAIFSSNKEDF